jgi:predicted nucleotidyltransferase
MVRVAVCLVVLCASLARADLKTDVDKLVRASLKAAAADKLDDFEKTTAAARVLVLPNGKTSLDGKLAGELYGASAKKIAHKVEALHIVGDTDKKLAWFHGTFTATFVVDKKKQTMPMRVSGIAADEGEPLGWKIQALMIARTMPDKELATHAIEAARGAPKTTGESTATKIIAAWFADGGSIAKDRSKNVAVEVNGTGAAEIGNGAFAVKLVQLWEAAKMWATDVEATLFANNEIAFVRAEVMLPYKSAERRTRSSAEGDAQVNDNLAAKLVLGVVLVKENNTWRWVTMSFSPVIAP